MNIMHIQALISGNFLNIASLLVILMFGHRMSALLPLISWACAYLQAGFATALSDGVFEDEYKTAVEWTLVVLFCTCIVTGAAACVYAAFLLLT